MLKYLRPETPGNRVMSSELAGIVDTRREASEAMIGTFNSGLGGGSIDRSIDDPRIG
jgi:hypothetical protein